MNTRQLKAIPGNPWGIGESIGGGPGFRVKALCEDGVTRSAVTTSFPDTFFSVPAAVKVKGKTVSGFLSMGHDEEYNERVEFTALMGRKNTHMIETKEGVTE